MRRYPIKGQEKKVATVIFETISPVNFAALSAGQAYTARLFCRDNGSGKSQLCVIFATGAIQVVATEP